MEFRILGPLEVRSELGVVALGGRKPRAVLAVLLMHANEPVSAERLALALWGEDAPGDAVKTVRVHVSRLRKALGDGEVVTTTSAGYRLRVREGELDAERFERLVAEGRRALAAGRAEQAASLLREGLALWRGPPLAGLASMPFAAAEIARLEEQQLAALEARVEADLAAGRHAELIGELQQLTSRHPWRERLHAQLMLALYRAGRQADALEAYRNAREALVEQLGIEPGQELRRLQQAILDHDAALDAPAETAVGAPDGAEEQLVDGRYRLLRPLGRGAVKDVFVAHDQRLDRDVALSLLVDARGGEAIHARIDREARVTARLGDHPHIVTLHDAGEDGAVPYFVARLMRGGSLAQRLEEAAGRRLAVAEAVGIACEVAEALAHAHAHGVVHRDVKPDNVWLDEHGHAALGDFGIARAGEQGRLTREGTPIGTPLYMSPEQIRGERDVDARTDLYSLGATLYEMLCGQPPFSGAADAVAIGHLTAPPVPPQERRPEVSEALGSAVLVLLAKRREDRPPSAEQARGRLLAAMAKDENGGGPLLGRDRELELGRHALRHALAGSGRLLAVNGEPGMGKTTLVQQLAREAAGLGAAVIWSGCGESDGAPPYWMWVQALRVLPDATGCAVPPALEQLMPEHAGPIAVSAGDSPEKAHFRRYAAATELLQRAGAARPLVLVFDDLHLADQASVDLLRRLADDLHRMRVMVLATYREPGRADNGLDDAIAHFATQRQADVVELGGLHDDDIAELLERTGGFRSPRLAGALAAHTNGNPFFVCEIVRMLIAEGGLEEAGRHPEQSLESVPSTVRHVVRHRLRAVTDPTRRVLDAAAVQGAEFDADVVSAAVELPPIAAWDALEEAKGEQLVRERDAGGGWAFAHAIVQRVVYEQLSGTRRARLHAAVARALAGTAEDVGQLAHHYCIAASVGIDAPAAVEYSCLAAERAAGLLAYETAVEHLQRALGVLERRGRGAANERCEVLLRLAEARECAGDTEGAKRDRVRAAAVARESGAYEQLALAARDRAEWAAYGVIDDEAIGLLRDALERLPAGDSALRAELLALLAARMDPVEDQPERELLIDEAIDVVRRLGRREALPMLLSRKALIAAGPGREHVRAAATREAIGSGTGDREGALWAHAVRFADALAVGSIDAADAELDDYAEIARHVKRPYYDWYLLVLRGTREAFRGDVEQAARLVDSARARIGELEPDSEHEWVVQRHMLARLTGRPGETPVDLLHAYAERYPSLLMWRAMAASADAELGRFERAAHGVELCLLDGMERVQRDPDRLTTLVFLADTVASLDDSSRARELLAVLEPEADRNVVTERGWAAWGPVARVLGRLAAASGDGEAATAHFERATTLDRRWSAPGWLVHAVVDYARALPDAPAVPALLEETDAVNAEHGLEALDRRLAGALQRP